MNRMIISKQPSLLSLPQVNPGVSSVLEYLIVKLYLATTHVRWESALARWLINIH